MSTELAIRPKASVQLASFIGMDANVMLNVIRAQCFKGNNVTDEQLAAFVSIAAEMGVNPLLPGMLYAYPTTGGGIVPMMGPDGIYKKLTEHADVDSWETTVFPEDTSLPPTHATTKIWRKGRERPLTYTATLSEWKVQSNPNWSSRPRHMLGIRSLKQCARQIIHGVPMDEDERVISELDITPRSREIPRAEIGAGTQATPVTMDAVDAVVIPPATKASAKAATRKPATVTAEPVAEEPKPAEDLEAPKPAAKPDEKPAATQAQKPAPKPEEKPADAGGEPKTPQDNLRGLLAADQHSEETLVKMAKLMKLVPDGCNGIDGMSAATVAMITEDWATAADAMDQIAKK